jgi:hypothetical protein
MIRHLPQKQMHAPNALKHTIANTLAHVFVQAVAHKQEIRNAKLEGEREKEEEYHLLLEAARAGAEERVLKAAEDAASIKAASEKKIAAAALERAQALRRVQQLEEALREKDGNNFNAMEQLTIKLKQQEEETKKKQAEIEAAKLAVATEKASGLPYNSTYILTVCFWFTSLI